MTTKPLTIDIEATKANIRARFGTVAEFIDTDPLYRKRRSMLHRIMSNDYTATRRPESYYQELLLSMKRAQVLAELPEQ